jgi:phosphotransferase system  glucose/maltose/N-acetylglucosamine-specific IIC component
MIKTKSILKNKKADMNFWLVMLVIALIFMVVVFFVMNKVFDFFGDSTEKIQGDIEKQQKETSIFEGLGASDSSSEDSSSDSGS